MHETQIGSKMRYDYSKCNKKETRIFQGGLIKKYQKKKELFLYDMFIAKTFYLLQKNLNYKHFKCMKTAKMKLSLINIFKKFLKEIFEKNYSKTSLKSLFTK